MDARLEAHLLRTLLDEPWDDVAPDTDEELRAYCRTLWALLERSFSDEGIAEYEATVVPGERFADVARFRLYLEREIEKRRHWLFSRAGVVTERRRRVVR